MASANVFDFLTPHREITWFCSFFLPPRAATRSLAMSTKHANLLRNCKERTKERSKEKIDVGHMSIDDVGISRGISQGYWKYKRIPMFPHVWPWAEMRLSENGEAAPNPRFFGEKITFGEARNCHLSPCTSYQTLFTRNTNPFLPQFTAWDINNYIIEYINSRSDVRSLDSWQRIAGTTCIWRLEAWSPLTLFPKQRSIRHFQIHLQGQNHQPRHVFSIKNVNTVF